MDVINEKKCSYPNQETCITAWKNEGIALAQKQLDSWMEGKSN